MAKYIRNPRMIVNLEEAIKTEGNSAWLVELISKCNEIGQHDLALELFYKALNTFDGGTSKGILFLQGSVAHIGTGAIDKGIYFANKVKEYYPDPTHETHKRANQLLEVMVLKKTSELNK